MVVHFPESLTSLQSLQEVAVCNGVPAYSVLSRLPGLERLHLQYDGAAGSDGDGPLTSPQPLRGVAAMTQLRGLSAQRAHRRLQPGPRELGALTQMLVRPGC